MAVGLLGGGVMPVQDDVRVTISVNKDLKDRADALFGRLGMNMTTAINVFLYKAVDEEAIPFSVSPKDAVFRNGYTSADVMEAFDAAVRDEIAASRLNGHPVARYDGESKRAYLEYPDGKREYVNA